MAHFRMLPSELSAEVLTPVALLCAVALLSAPGCGDFGCGEREDAGMVAELAAPEWTFDGERIVATERGLPLTGPIFDMDWSAVVDADAREVAPLVIGEEDRSPLEEVEPGRRWVSRGYVRGPGPERSEVLRDNRLIRYSYEIEVEDERTLEVTYSANVLQHVVLTSFSGFMIRLPIGPYAGARAEVNGGFGGMIFEHGPPPASHPSYWEGPMRSLEIETDLLTLTLDVEEGGFNWVSFLDGRALPRPDSSLIVRLYPALAGPHERLGSLAARGTQYSTSFSFTIGAPSPHPGEPTARGEPSIRSGPAPLPSSARTALLEAGWEMEPFVSPGETPGDPPLSLNSSAAWCELPVRGGRESWGLGVGGAGPPRPAFVAMTGPAEDIRLKINGKGDCLDGGEFVREIAGESRSWAGLAEAVWRRAAGTTYAMPLHPTDDLGEFLGSYGYGFSSTLSAVALVKLWIHAGLPARRTYLAGRTGYAIAETFYDGDWHAFDLTDRTFYVDPADGAAASAEELVANPDLVRMNSNAGGAGPGGVPAEVTAREKYEGAEITYNAGGISLERLMRTSLVRGETLIKLYRSLGRWAPAPHEPYRYANALLVFEPDLEGPDPLEAFWGSENVTVRGGALTAEDRSLPAWIEYHARTPYVITQSSLEVAGDLPTLNRVSIMLSTDAGGSWHPVRFDPSTGGADLSPLLVPGPQEPGAAYENLRRSFGFLLHVAISPSDGGQGTGISSITVQTWGQMNPALLPRPRRGENVMETRCGAWGPGASVTLGWIEGDSKVVPGTVLVGEEFTVEGTLLRRDDGPAGDVEVEVLLKSGARPVSLGSWRPRDPLPRGEKVPFEIPCSPVDPDEPATRGPISELDLAIEIKRLEEKPGLESWSSRRPLSIPLAYRPDLVILPSMVSHSPASPEVGRQVLITATVRNFCPTRDLLYMQGTESPPCKVTLYQVEGGRRVPLGSIQLPPIPPGSAAPASFRWMAPQRPGPVSLLIAVDPEDEIREMDEANSAEINFSVSAAGP